MNTLSKNERIELRKKEIGSKHHRKLKKYSNGFNEMFNFFLITYRTKFLDFCGSKVNVVYDSEGPDGKECFRLLEDGFYKGKEEISTRHPNIVLGVITGKKSWGLWKNEWIDGIVEGSFTKYEILQEFKTRSINIPTPLFKDFNKLTASV